MKLDVVQDISPLDDMFQGNREHYFGVGESALECIHSVILAAGKQPAEIRSILDLPCGYGRVLRVLKAAFPEARLTACDLERGGVDFCARKFGAYPIYSDKNLSKIPIHDRFDLIWVGSLLTHLNLQAWRDFMRFFADHLNPGGLLVMSFHGPDMIRRMRGGRTYELSTGSVESILRQYEEREFGYENYPNSGEYGISVASPAFIRNLVAGYPDLRWISYAEHAWDNHHDVLGCQKQASAQSLPDNQPETRSDANPGDSRARMPAHPAARDYRVVFSLPEGLTLGGVTTWSVELSRALQTDGWSTSLGLHPSRYNNPPVDFGITAQDRLIDCTDLPHPDDPRLQPQDYLPRYQKELPAVLIPSWSWGTYAMTALLASRQPERLRVVGMAHADESGYYQWLVHYEAMIHKFIVANREIQRKLSRMLPHRFDDILVRACPVRVPTDLTRSYSKPGEPLQLVYGGRIAQYQKRVFDLLDLASALAKERLDFRFRIIGGGADRDRFLEKISLLPRNVRSLISFEESVPLSSLPEVWRSADINVLVSDFEGMSNSILMGMAEGCVPVMTDVSGAAEVVRSGENGYLTPVGDIGRMVEVIKSLDRDRNQLASLGRRAHETMKAEYSLEEYAPWFEDVLKGMWAEPARPWPPARSPEPFELIHQQFLRLEHSGKRAAANGTGTRKRLLFISHEAIWGGASKVLFSLVTGLDADRWSSLVAMPDQGELQTKLAERGVQTVITPLQHVTTDAQAQWQQYERFSRQLPERVSQVVDIIDREGVDLVVTNTACIMEGALAARLAGIPHVWYVHELLSLDGKLTPPLDYPTFYATMDSLADRIVVISKAVENEICGAFPSKKVQLIYTGLKPVASSAPPDRLRVLGVAPGIPVVTFVGIMSERKGVLGLVDVASLVVQRLPQVVFLMVGPKQGPTFERLRQMIKERGLDHNFSFLGFRSDVADILGCSDVVVIPSTAEPFSLVALEAMEAGKPVVATRSGGPEEIVRDAATGFLVPVNSPYEMAQAVIGLLIDRGKAAHLGQNGQARAREQFDHDAYIRNFASLFEDLTSKPRQAFCVEKNTVDNLVRLMASAARARSLLAEIQPADDPGAEVRHLLEYPDNLPVEISPVAEGGATCPKVSVCIPVYNGEKYLRECIESVLSQTFTEFELVIVNDASTDSSKQLVQAYRDPRIRYHENDANLGLVGNWNRCLQLSRGEYVCVFHQDDAMEAGNLERKVAALESDPQLGMVYSDAAIVDEHGRHSGEHWFNAVDPNVDFVRSGQSFFDLLLGNLNVVSCPTVLARRACYEQIGGFDTRLPFSVDMEMWMRIALFYDVAYLAAPLVQYRYHESNLTRRFVDLDLIHVYLAKKMILEKYPGRFDLARYGAWLVADTSQRVFQRAIHHYEKQEYRLAKQYLTFLKLIRKDSKGQDVMDTHIDELLKFVDQANALQWIGWADDDRESAAA